MEIDDIKTYSFADYKVTGAYSNNSSDNSQSNEEKPIRLDEVIHCSVFPHRGRTLLDVTLPIQIDRLFTLIFTNSDFILNFHNDRKSTDLKVTPWTQNSLDNSKSRVVTLTVNTGQLVGPKTSQVTETDVMLPCSKPGYLYAINIETVNAGIPYADSFFVAIHYCIQKVSETHSSIKVFGQIEYTKSVWSVVKGIIAKNVDAGLDDYYEHLARALKSEGGENAIECKTKQRRKRRNRAMSATIENNRIDKDDKITRSTGYFSTAGYTPVVSLLFIALVLLNITLYYKLSSLEDSMTYTLLDLQILQNPPQTHEAWIKLLQQKEFLYSVEAQNWQRLLKKSLDLLIQAEDAMNELKRSIHSTNKRPPNQKDQEENKTDL